MAGRKQKLGPAVPEKITKYFQRMKGSDNGNVEMECEDPAPEKEAEHSQLRMNLDRHDCDHLNPSQAECHSQSKCSGVV